MADFPDWTVPTNIQNPQIDVNVVGGNINANITNSEIGVNIKGSETTLNIQGDVNAKITNTPIDVNVQGGNIDANITNSEINTIIKDSDIILEIQQSDWKNREKVYGVQDVEPDKWGHYPIVYFWITHGARGYIVHFEVWVRNTGSTDESVSIVFREDFTTPVRYSTTKTVPAGQTVKIEEDLEITWLSDTLVMEVWLTTSAYLEIGLRTDAGYKTIARDPDTHLPILIDGLCGNVKIITLNTPSVAVSGQPSSLLMGYDYSNKVWRPVSVNQDGKLLAVLG
ncbi:MAG: hypothetical protein DRZ76_02985 [Candidatus Nealsonbacteria bacterium]|nr:MAG: hypothetical protein DRZ76_02985 [Candidatus Nealsonbacteria bacterium]